MGVAYHGELSRLSADLGLMCELATAAMASATHALMGQHLTLAEQVITDDSDIDDAHARFERTACGVLALYAPIAGELRAVIGMIQIGERIQRMGDLARHIAEAARRRHPVSAVPAALEECFAEMGELGVAIGRQVSAAIAHPGTAEIERLELLDDRIDQLEATILNWVSTQQDDVRAGVDVALLARFFERYADQGVSAARRLQYIAGPVPLRRTDTPA
jgi:phosphate transport system protein